MRPTRIAVTALAVLFLTAAVACGEELPAATPSSSAPETTAPAPSTATAAAPELSEASPLRLDGIGPVRIGMTLVETDGSKVLVFRSGNDEAVRDVEGCA
ncbi:MAG: hypothetical protein ACRDZ7_14660 [Acidimicrobiia bacterium]